MKNSGQSKSVLGSMILVASVTLAILLALFIAMLFLDEMNWGLADFVAIGVLLFGGGLAYELIARRVTGRRQKLIFGILIILAVAYIWAELGVGILTNLGS